MQPTTEPVAGARLPLSWRIFLLVALLLGAILAAVVAVTQRQGQRIAAEAVERALGASGEVQAEFTRRRLGEVELKLQLIALDPAFVQYVADAQGGGLGLGSEGLPDAGSIDDLLRERQAGFGFDLGIVLDTAGNVLARTDTAEAFAESLADDAFVAPVLESLEPVSGFWRRGVRLYQAALMPLAQKDDLVGFLLLATAVDDALGRQVGQVSGADVAFLLPESDGVSVVGSSLDAAGQEALKTALAASPLAPALAAGTAMERTEIAFAGQRWAARLAPLDSDAGPGLGSVLQLYSSDRAAAGYREILNLVGLVGLAGLVIALPLSFLLAKATLRPLTTMAKAAQEAAAGNYQTRIGLAGSDELGQLSRAIDSLLSDLREKSDIEGYVSNLSRFLPEPGQKAEPVAAAKPPREPARRELLLLVALDLRDLAKALGDTPGDALLGELALRHERLDAEAARRGGRCLARSGARPLYGFAGDARLDAALAFLRRVFGEEPNAAAAIIEGEVVHGPLAGAGDRVAVGPTLAQAERLLQESAAGRLLLPRTLGGAVKARVGDAQLTVSNGAISGKPFYTVMATGLAAIADVDAAAADDPMATVRQPAAAASVPGRVSRSGELLPGTRFGGRFEILSVLGSGGMGVVYKARDLELDDVVALKTLKSAALVDREHLERLKSEIKLARRITHPNVLRTFDFGEQDGVPYISMEYVRGMTLRYLIREAGRIPYSAALRIARQLCAGLAAAHEVGVLHRDIKPENLILEQSGNAKLMDFGIARPIRRSEPGQTEPGMFVGTPAYSAPEQLAALEVDHRADIYASGVLLCEMFCGKLPFTGANTMEIYLAQMQSVPIRPSEHWPDIPPALEAIILRCLEREPAARYGSAQELGAALAQLRA